MKFKKTSKRTIFLALFSGFAFVWAAIRYFDVPPEVMLNIFIASIVMLVVLVAVAFILVAVLRFLRR